MVFGLTKLVIKTIPPIIDHLMQVRVWRTPFWILTCFESDLRFQGWVSEFQGPIPISVCLNLLMEYFENDLLISKNKSELVMDLSNTQNSSKSLRLTHEIV